MSDRLTDAQRTRTKKIGMARITNGEEITPEKLEDLWKSRENAPIMKGLLRRNQIESGAIYPGHPKYEQAVIEMKAAEGIEEPQWRVEARAESKRLTESTLAEWRARNRGAEVRLRKREAK